MAEATQDVTAPTAAGDDRFLRRDERFGIERTALTTLPVVDISPFIKGGTDAARRQVGREIRSACIDIGFFYVTGYGIAQAEMDELIEWGHRFFALPLDEKMAIHRNNDPTQSNGYMQAGGTDKAADLKENYCISREVEPGEPAEGRYAAGRTQWPVRSHLPGFEEFQRAHFVKRQTVAQRMVRAFALSLDLPESYFDAAFRYPGCNLVYNYYPPIDPNRTDRSQWSIAPHADYGAFTMLAQDKLSGLQVRNAAGQWIDVTPIPDTFVVNLGDTMARWTNDLYASSLHRALNLNSGVRVSVPFFTFPHGRTEIRCLETCQGPDNPPRNEPIIAEDYMLQMLRAYFSMGRPSIAQKNLERLNS